MVPKQGDIVIRRGFDAKYSEYDNHNPEEIKKLRRVGYVFSVDNKLKKCLVQWTVDGQTEYETIEFDDVMVIPDEMKDDYIEDNVYIGPSVDESVLRILRTYIKEILKI